MSTVLSRASMGILKIVPSVVLALASISASASPLVFTGVESYPFGGSSIAGPNGLAADNAGNVYAALPATAQVVKVRDNGAGGVPYITGVAGATGLALDPAGHLWITSNPAHGTGVVYEYSTGASPALVNTFHGFSNPTGIASDAAGNIYVTEAGSNRITKIVGNNKSTLVSSGLTSPAGLAVDPTGATLYIADAGAHQVAVASTATGTLGPAISAPGSCAPAGVAVNGAGDLLIGCAAGGIFKVPNEAGTLTVADEAQIVANGVATISALTTDGTGDLFASDGTSTIERVQLGPVDFGNYSVGFASSPTYNLIFNVASVANQPIGSIVSYIRGIPSPSGSDEFHFTSTTCPTNGTLNAGSTCTVVVGFSPSGIGDRVGSIVVYDPGNNPILTIPIHGLSIGPRIAYGPGNQSSISTAGLSGPTAVALDGDGNRYVADCLNNRIVEIPFNSSSGQTVGGAVTCPDGVAIDGSGNLFASDANLGVVEFVNNNGTFSTTPIVVDPATTLPVDVKFDKNGNLYVADTLNNRIVKVPTENGVLNYLHQTVIGSGLSQPEALEIDSAGNVIIADSGNNRIVQVAPDGTQQNVPVDTATLGALDTPAGLAVDAAGDIYLADTNNNRIIYISANRLTQAVIPSNSSNGFGVLGAPGGLAIDPIGQLWVPDFLNNRLVEIQDLVFSLTFPGPQAPGSVSAPRVIQVSNIGNYSLQIPSIAFAPLPAQFEQVSVDNGDIHDCPNIGPSNFLTPGGSCFIGVAFAPTTGGEQSGTLGVKSTDFNAPAPDYTTDFFNLIGNAPAVVANPTSLTFPATQQYGVPGVPPPTLTFTLQNLTNSPVVINFGGLPGDFSINSQTCNGSIAANSFCNVTIAFRPQTVGPINYVFVITASTDGGHTFPYSVNILLSGTGTAIPAVATPPGGKLTGASAGAGSLAVSPSTLNFGSLSTLASPTASVQITNRTKSPSYVAFHVSRVYLAGTTCNGALAAGASCSVGVGLPPGPAGVVRGSLTTTLIPAGGGALKTKHISVWGIRQAPSSVHHGHHSY